jgi:hypothetical protein
MAGNGDIGDVTRLVDTITGAAGAQEASKFTTPWTAVAPTLTTGSHATPPEQGGLESDGGSGTNPDLYVGSFALASATPTLGVGSVAGPVGKGDVGDVFGAPDLAGEAQVAGLAAFTSGSPTLGLGTVTAPPEHGDIGDTGGPTTLQGDVNDSNQGVSTLTSWSSGTATLSLGSIPQTRSHGDIGEMVGQGEGPIGQVVWQQVADTLTVTNVMPAPQGQGDISAGIEGTLYAPDPTTWLVVISKPVLTDIVIGGQIILSWTPLVAELPSNVFPTYTVFRSVNGGAFTTYATTQNMTFADSALTRGPNTYSYYIQSNVPQEICISNIVSEFGQHIDTYNTPGTYIWVKPPGTVVLDFPNWVGSGGGGTAGGLFTGSGSGSSGGGGASGGGYAQIFGVPTSQVPATVTVTIGAHGIGGARSSSVSGNPGTNGDTTSFGSFITCTGGIAGGGPQSAFISVGGTGTISGLTGTYSYTEAGGTGRTSNGNPFPNVDGGSTTLAPAGGGGGTQGDAATGNIAGTGGSVGALAGGVGGANTTGQTPPPGSGGGVGGNGQNGTGEGPGLSICGSGAGAGGNRIDNPTSQGGDAGATGLYGAGGAGGGAGWCYPSGTPTSGAGSDGGLGYGKVISYRW